ncbi:MAG: hypothetical protein SynsKO_22570 [Synoicihabitans sp.]
MSLNTETSETEREEWVTPTLRNLQISETEGASAGPSGGDGGGFFNDYNS